MRRVFTNYKRFVVNVKTTQSSTSTQLYFAFMTYTCSFNLRARPEWAQSAQCHVVRADVHLFRTLSGPVFNTSKRQKLQLCAIVKYAKCLFFISSRQRQI